MNSTIHSRHLEDRLLEQLNAWPGVLLLGPRQSGKTTLAKRFLAPRGFAHLDFDDDATRKSATRDPAGFVAGLPDNATLDEVQRVPEIVLELKRRIDNNRERVSYLLTGSCRLIRRMPDSLAGRLVHLRLFPLSRCERAGVAPQFIDDLFGARFRLGKCPRLGTELLDMIALGGYPAVQPDTSTGIRIRWHDSLVTSLMERDMGTLGRVGYPDIPPRLLAAAVAQTARLLNASDLGTAFGATHPTIRRYIRLLEDLFLLETLPPWGPNRMTRMVKSPKLHVCDTGLACGLLGIDAGTLAIDHDLRGQMTETFVYQELRRQAGGRDIVPKFHHYRTKDRAEVDIVIELGGRVAGVEVKAGESVSGKDFGGLRKLAEETGSRFACGVVLHGGEICAPFGDRLYAVPIRRLWEAAT